MRNDVLMHFKHLNVVSREKNVSKCCNSSQEIIWILICKIRIAIAVNLYVTKYNTVRISSILVKCSKNYKVFSFSWKVKKSEIRLFDSSTTISSSLKPLKSQEKLHLIMLSVYVVCWIFLQTFQTYFCIQANSVDPDQTAPRGAVWSGSTLFAKMTFKITSRWQSRRQ